MDIEVLIKEKEMLAERIHTAIREESERFRQKTGFSPQSVQVYFREITGLGDRHPRYMVEEVIVSIDATGVEL